MAGVCPSQSRWLLSPLELSAGDVFALSAGAACATGLPECPSVLACSPDFVVFLSQQKLAPPLLPLLSGSAPHLFFVTRNWSWMVLER